MLALSPLTALVRTDYGIAAGLALVVIALGAIRMVPGVTGVFHDDAIYVITARALAEGDGYRLINLPGEPLQTKYPILYPAALALVWKLWPVFPENLLAMQWLTLLCGACAVGFTFLYLVRFGYASRLVAALICATVATTPFVLHVSTLTLSEMPFALLLIAALWRCERWLRAAPSRASDLTTGVIVGLPFLCRSLGLALVAAFLAVAVARRRFSVPLALGAAACTVPWLARSNLAGAPWQADALVGYYTDYAGAWASLGWEHLRAVVGLNGLLLPHATIAAPLAGLDEWLARGGWSPGPVFAVAGLIAWGLVVVRSARLTPLAPFLVVYGAACLVWPWPPHRFVLPVLPLVLVQLARPPASGNKRGRLVGVARIAALAVATAAILANTALDLRTAVQNQTSRYPYRVSVADPAQWSQYEALFGWIRENTASDTVIGAGLDTMVYAYTGRQAIRPFPHRPDGLFYAPITEPLGGAAELRTALASMGVDVLVLTPMPDFAETEAFRGQVAALQAADATVLEEVYSDANGRFTVLWVCARDPEPSGSAGRVEPCRSEQHIRDALR